MKSQLSNIATVQAGVFASPEKNAEVLYLQAKHFNDEGILENLLYPELKLSNKIQRFLLQDEDILFAAKGSRNFAVVYRSKYGNAVASSTFLVIRLNSSFRLIVLPEFLAWYINHSKNLGTLKAAATGSNIQIITSSVLKDMEVNIPSVEKQKTILKIHHLHNKELKLSLQLDSLREILIQNRLLQAAKL